MHRYEDTKQRTFAVDTAQAVAIGDMCFLNTDDIREAGQFTWDTSLAVTQRAFSKVFAGVSLDRKIANDTITEVGIARAGICEFTCVAATFEIGDIDTGFGVSPDVVEWDIIRAGVKVTADSIMTKLGGGDAGKVRIADGAATYTMTSGDVIVLTAYDKV